MFPISHSSFTPIYQTQTFQNSQHNNRPIHSLRTPLISHPKIDQTSDHRKNIIFDYLKKVSEIKKLRQNAFHNHQTISFSTSSSTKARSEIKTSNSKSNISWIQSSQRISKSSQNTRSKQRQMMGLVTVVNLVKKSRNQNEEQSKIFCLSSFQRKTMKNLRLKQELKRKKKMSREIFDTIMSQRSKKAYLQKIYHQQKIKRQVEKGNLTLDDIAMITNRCS